MAAIFSRWNQEPAMDSQLTVRLNWGHWQDVPAEIVAGRWSSHLASTGSVTRSTIVGVGMVDGLAFPFPSLWRRLLHPGKLAAYPRLRFHSG